MAGEPLTNCRLLPPAEKLRLTRSSPSPGSTPDSSKRRLSSDKPLPAKIASTVHASAPVRMSDLSARSPRSNLSAPIMIDLPAPVSPVTAVKPGCRFHSKSSTRARFLIRSKLNTAAMPEKLTVESRGLPDETCGL